MAEGWKGPREGRGEEKRLGKKKIVTTDWVFVYRILFLLCDAIQISSFLPSCSIDRLCPDPAQKVAIQLFGVSEFWDCKEPQKLVEGEQAIV